MSIKTRTSSESIDIAATHLADGLNELEWLMREAEKTDAHIVICADVLALLKVVMDDLSDFALKSIERVKDRYPEEMAQTEKMIKNANRNPSN